MARPKRDSRGYFNGHASAAFMAAVYGHALPEPVRAAIIGLGEIFTYDIVLELPVRKQ